MLYVRLGFGHKQMTPRFLAYVDSGSPYCIFRWDLATYLGIDLSNSFHDDVSGIIAGTSEKIYFHKVKLQVDGEWLIEITAGFVKKFNTAGILGRIGFFDNFKITFDHSGHPPAFEIERMSRPS
jgi:hypothetical protein